MEIAKIEGNAGKCIVITGNEKVITDAQSALELLIDAIYTYDTNCIVIDKNLICDDFFILSTGVAGEILEKFSVYNGRIAIWGDFSHYTSKPLKDFMYESNKGKTAFFCSSREEGIAAFTE